jgi:hypothetical protein
MAQLLSVHRNTSGRWLAVYELRRLVALLEWDRHNFTFRLIV